MKFTHWMLFIIAFHLSLISSNDCLRHDEVEERLDRIERMLEDVRYE